MPRNEVVIRFVLPRWSRRRWLGSALALGVLGAAVAYAAPQWPFVAPTYRQGDPLSAATLTSQLAQVGDNLNDVDARIRTLQTQLAALQVDPDCPRGYGRFTDNAFPNAVLCQKGSDEVVRVGGWPGKTTGPEVFWIDRYEASVWDSPGGGGARTAGS